ncbi:AraC family transcriptional regulator [Pseudomonas akapageensis]|uniref:AraC family transcriptional regulator n=1 Tax=Pseudomonas akapageensis TaxID=2609961 RepID=UPI00140A8550|nr:AraC family transcriptional regulator [Pseudomonas akapageensis]
MSHANYTVFSETLLQRHSEIFRPFLASVGLSPDVVDHADKELPLGSYIDLLETTAENIDPCLGLRLGLGQLNSSNTGSYLGAFGHAARSAANVREMLNFVARYLVVHAHANELTWCLRGGRVEVHYQLTDPSITRRRQDAEFAMAGLYTTLCTVTDNKFAPLRVDFAHPQPADISPHQQAFQCPLRFSQPINAMVWPGRILEEPLVTADERLFQALQPFLEEQRKKRLADTDLTARISQAIAGNLRAGHVGLDAIAKQLSFSPRTLQRRLQEQDLEFNALVEEIRIAKALEYMENSSRSVNDIALGLGYTEASSFTRAFRRWTGLSPREFRQQRR